MLDKIDEANPFMKEFKKLLYSEDEKTIAKSSQESSSKPDLNREKIGNFGFFVNNMCGLLSFPLQYCNRKHQSMLKNPWMQGSKIKARVSR